MSSSDDEPLIRANPRKTDKAVASSRKRPADSDSDDVPLIRATPSNRATKTGRGGLRVTPSPTSSAPSAISTPQMISPADSSDSDDEPLISKIPPRKRALPIKTQDTLTDDDDDDPVLSTIKLLVKTEEADVAVNRSKNASTPAPLHAPRLLKASGFTSEYCSLSGLWTMNPAKTHDNAPVYQKRNWISKRMVYLYYSAQSGQQGWWIGPDIGGDTAWILNDQKTVAGVAHPPIRGWKVPFHGPVDPRVTVSPMDPSSTVKELDTIILQHELKRKRRDSETTEALVTEKENDKWPASTEKRRKNDDKAKTSAVCVTNKDSFLKTKQEDYLRRREERSKKWAKQLEKWDLMRQRRKKRDIHLRPDEWRFREVLDGASSVGDDDPMFGDFNIDFAIGGVPECPEKIDRISAIQARLNSILAEVDKVFEEDNGQ
eukprot:GEMP01029717.1.p1 GENE.GEMP01029717.1~~GEMP01029717.1.p1  ORF type:complete len:431 (+),score=97.36 GEMP01029717.1:50-1342(+)